MKYSLKTKLSLSIAVVVLLTVALVSLLANYFIENQFKNYIATQQQKTAQEIVGSISRQYDPGSNTWNVDFVHTIGMYALYDGYIVKVYDRENQTVWDAEACDMSLCTNVMNDITHRMMEEYPNVNGEFTSKDFPVYQDSGVIGTVNISYFGPYFLSENDFRFIDSLNKILITIGFLSLILSIAAGILMAKRLSRPILKTADAAKQISAGDYTVRIQEDPDTKEVEALTESINQLAASLENQEKLRRRLTADVAHELRTPLATVQTHLEAIIEGVWEPTKERLESCYDEMSRISNLVKDLEKLAKIESENLKLNKSPVDLLELTKKVIMNFEKETKTKNQQVSILGNSQEIYADRDRISQVLINLVSNAVKYTPDGGDIKITISQTEDAAIFQIEDSGAGIPEEEIPFIFERFYRADKSRNRMTGGSGIGLAIVKSIVEAHGGSIQVESRVEEGSSFMVILPKGKEMEK
ncbi:sensor histidine kinase [Sinanaerobacter chloroacetimidivorans]|jgi:two-component system sensor histidine kinase BaeS|uniref:histidine kinase n=1 Tax=Sinanaerobacter chloroacetimidivorans TaxID=2818044 RepID=A0A8J8B1I3_9FIRM|nr:HAMP domain-containing sensor histidine kinase [Sinanaerobacter chloroacetimidivorans]MBR0598748.1 HAMP domain-containing histidine kinase [Sinanaerobacter chloroacetimidivorans]